MSIKKKVERKQAGKKEPLEKQMSKKEPPRKQASIERLMGKQMSIKRPMEKQVSEKTPVRKHISTKKPEREKKQEVVEGKEELDSIDRLLAEQLSTLEKYLDNKKNNLFLLENIPSPQEVGSIDAAIMQLVCKTLEPYDNKLETIEERISDLEQKNDDTTVLKLINRLRFQNEKIRELETRLKQLEK